jgi:hypothetical protein
MHVVDGALILSSKRDWPTLMPFSHIAVEANMANVGQSTFNAGSLQDNGIQTKEFICIQNRHARTSS